MQAYRVAVAMAALACGDIALAQSTTSTTMDMGGGMTHVDTMGPNGAMSSSNCMDMGGGIESCNTMDMSQPQRTYPTPDMSRPQRTYARPGVSEPAPTFPPPYVSRLPMPAAVAPNALTSEQPKEADAIFPEPTNPYTTEQIELRDSMWIDDTTSIAAEAQDARSVTWTKIATGQSGTAFYYDRASVYRTNNDIWVLMLVDARVDAVAPFLKIYETLWVDCNERNMALMSRVVYPKNGEPFLDAQDHLIFERKPDGSIVSMIVPEVCAVM